MARINWLLWWSLVRAGEHEWAERSRQNGLGISSLILGTLDDQLMGAVDREFGVAVIRPSLMKGQGKLEDVNHRF